MIVGFLGSGASKVKLCLGPLGRLSQRCVPGSPVTARAAAGAMQFGDGAASGVRYLMGVGSGWQPE